jgi:hypothetical protein
LLRAEDVLIPLSFQVFRSPFFKPEFADVFPTYSAPLFRRCLQVIQIFRFQKIFLGSLLKYRKALGARSEELLKNQLLAWAPPVLTATPSAA